MRDRRGFTLIELMIVVLVIAVLASIALSGYNNQVRKSRRSEAKQVLADLGLKQEKYRSNNVSYGTIIQLGGASATTYYSVCPVAATCTTSATGYVLVAVPTGDQLKDSCGTLRWEMTAGVVSKTSTSGTDCW